MTFIKVIKLSKKKILCSSLILTLGLSGIGIKKITHFNSDKNKVIIDKSRSFVLEEGVTVDESLLNEDNLGNMEISIDLNNSEPKVLITHTHISEEYKDEGTVEDIGNKLAGILAEKYGISVVHDISIYDKVNGKISLEEAYERMEENVQGILEKYPTIEVIIDLHRDAAAEGENVICRINGKNMAPLMLVNGVCSAEGSPPNPYLNENLALSLKVYKKAQKEYNGLFKKIYIKPYRYSTHLKPYSLLVEVGCQTNTLEEAENSLEPLAETLVKAIESK